MILYHFTAIEWLDVILSEGLSRGDVPLTQQDSEQAVWFTTTQSGQGHGLSDARELSEAEVAVIKGMGGRVPPGVKPRFPDKRRVRIRVVIPSRDRRLVEWLPFARKHLETRWMDILHQTGGGLDRAKTWWFFRGTVPPSDFTEVVVRRADGTFTPITTEDRNEAASYRQDAERSAS